MALKDVFKISRKTFFDPAGWLGANELSGYNRVIKDTLKTTFSTPRPEREETFDAALQRLNVTEADLQKTAELYRIYTFFFLLLSVGSFLTGFYYLFEYGTVAGWILALVVSALFAAQTFRFDFWYFQIKHRKLGCTFQEWWSSKLGSEKGPKP